VGRSGHWVDRSVIVCLAAFGLEKVKIDDPVGAVPVHFFNGLWGVIAVGLFASGNPDTAAWNGMDQAVTGLFYGGGAGQLMAQLFEAVTIAVVVFGASYVFFAILNRFGLMRSEPSAEVIGLDIPEMGAKGYWEGSHPNLRSMYSPGGK
jgi:Amt family ammonium transporter